MSALLSLAYDGTPMSFDQDGWFNATAAAARFGKRPVDWLRLPETERYVVALGRKSKVGKSHFARTVRGGAAGAAGTWLHPKLAIRFAQWLDIDFAVWCDEQIETIIRQGQAAGAVAVEYLPGYHELHDRVHELAAGSTHERFVHMNVNKLINKTVGIAAGSRGDLPPAERSTLVVAQMVAMRAMAAANDHHDGYQSAKAALDALGKAIAISNG